MCVYSVYSVSLCVCVCVKKCTINNGHVTPSSKTPNQIQFSSVSDSDYTHRMCEERKIKIDGYIIIDMTFMQTQNEARPKIFTFFFSSVWTYLFTSCFSLLLLTFCFFCGSNWIFGLYSMNFLVVSMQNISSFFIYSLCIYALMVNEPNPDHHKWILRNKDSNHHHISMFKFFFGWSWWPQCLTDLKRKKNLSWVSSLSILVFGVFWIWIWIL